MLKLTFQDNSDDPRWVVGKSFSIGSGDDNHLILNDPSVDIQHARIILTSTGYKIKDLGSQSGCYVNDENIGIQRLKHGDVIRVGETMLCVIDPNLEKYDSGWLLVACSSWLSGQEFPLHSKRGSKILSVGRSSSCDIIFPGTHLSRQHVEVRIEKDRLLVKDLKSANGTYINNKRVSEGELHSGDTLRLDVYDFTVFGPGKAPTNEQSRPTNTDENKQNSAAKLKTDKPSVPKGATPQKWKTKPTSPGNREQPLEVNHSNKAVSVLLIVLTCLLISFGIYLFV